MFSFVFPFERLIREFLIHLFIYRIYYSNLYDKPIINITTICKLKWVKTSFHHWFLTIQNKIQSRVICLALSAIYVLNVNVNHIYRLYAIQSYIHSLLHLI